MKHLRHYHRIASALALFVSWSAFAAVNYTGTQYEPWSYSAGCVVWRSTNSWFKTATVANVATGGTIGAQYEMDGAWGGTSWQRFWRNEWSGNEFNGAYTSPGRVLVYDKSVSNDGDEYAKSSELSQSIFALGGLWVKVLAADGSPFEITGIGDTRLPATVFGNTRFDGTTLFRFEKSYTIDRPGRFVFQGNVNVDVAQDAVFSINPSYPNQTASVPEGSKLVLTGSGSIAAPANAGLVINGTLDLSAGTEPTINGNVTFGAGATLVLPDGTTSATICTGTLATNGIIRIKIGGGVYPIPTIDGGTINLELVEMPPSGQTFTSDFPVYVPEGYTYTFVGGATPVETVTIPSVTVDGTLKTSGYVNLSNIMTAQGSNFEVLDGNATVTTTLFNTIGKLEGNIKVAAGATLTNTQTDSIDYNGTMTVDIYGTLAMGGTRWSIPAKSRCTFNLHQGAVVTGAGERNLGSLDFFDGDSRLNVLNDGTSGGTVVIEGAVRVRNDLTEIWIDENMSLEIDGGIGDGPYQTHDYGGFKQLGGGTLELHNNSFGLHGEASVVTSGTLRIVDVTKHLTLEMQSPSSLEVKATTATTTVPLDAVLRDGATFSFTGDGQVTGSLEGYAELDKAFSTFLTSSHWAGKFIVNWDISGWIMPDRYGNANSAVEVATEITNGWFNINTDNETMGSPSIAPALYFDENVTIDNGFCANEYGKRTTTFSKVGMAAGKTFKLRDEHNGSRAGTYYEFTALEDFEGTLIVRERSHAIIKTIVRNAFPSVGEIVLKATMTGSLSAFDDLDKVNISVDGVSKKVPMVYATIDGVSGLAPQTVVVTVPEVENTVVEVTVDGESVTGNESGEYEVLIGRSVIVTYCADGAYVVTKNPTSSFTADSDATIGTDVGTLPTIKAAKAQLMPAGTYYATTADSISAIIAVLDDDPTAYVQLLGDTTGHNIYGADGIGYDEELRRFGKAVATIDDEAGYLTLGAAVIVVDHCGSIDLVADCEDTPILENGKIVTIVDYGHTYTAPAAVDDYYTVDATVVAAGVTTYTGRDWYVWTVTYRNWNGDVLQETPVSESSPVTPAYDGATPAKAPTAEIAYVFAGWGDVAETVTEDVTYTAQFDEETRLYTITWLDDDGSSLGTSYLPYNATPSHEDPTRNLDVPYSQSFVGWLPAIATVTGDATYTATYTARKADLSTLTGDWTAADGDVILGSTTYNVTISAGARVTINGLSVSGGGSQPDSPEFASGTDTATTGFSRDADGSWILSVFAELANDALGSDVAPEQIKVYAADSIEGLKTATPLIEGVTIQEKKSAVKTTLKIATPSSPESQFFFVEFGE